MNARQTTKPGCDPAEYGHLVLKGITKKFHGVTALGDVTFDLRQGEVHVLFGENGAGKSTLINIIAGILSPTEGRIELDGHGIQFSDPQDARLQGISAVFQEFSLVGELTVEENLFLGAELTKNGVLQKAQMRAEAIKIMERLGFSIAPTRKVAALSRAEQQMVEIAKALLSNPRILILDEPTASLTEAESEKLFEFVRRLRDEGVGIIYISHRMREIQDLADRVTVLRDGRYIATVQMKDVTADDLVEMMTGRKAGNLYPDIPHNPGKLVLEAVNLSTACHSVVNASMTVHAGEIVGIAGLVGCGKSELIRAIFGLEEIERGKVFVDGEERGTPTAACSLDKGVCYFPSDRATEGLALGRPIFENASITALMEPKFSRNGMIKRRDEKALVTTILERLHLRPLQINKPAGALSGGNKQKVVLARGMARDTRVYLFDEPTVGIDVGAKAEIYALMKELVEEGAAVVLVSSELPEILGLSHRAYVMHNAHMVTELVGDEITEDKILSNFFFSETPIADAAE